MLLAGAGMLVLSMFVGRPYCRYLCPYGALLGMLTRVARWRPTVTPDACTRCRLCESACPFGALNQPLAAPPGSNRLAAARRRMLLLCVAMPLAALLFGWLGGRVGLATMPLHPVGERAALVMHEEVRADGVGKPPDEVTAFRHHGADLPGLLAGAAALERRLLHLGRGIGALFGLVLVLQILRVFHPDESADYETDRTHCVSCARCFKACPYELVRRGVPVAIPPPPEGGRG
jgi:ferredoxin